MATTSTTTTTTPTATSAATVTVIISTDATTVIISTDTTTVIISTAIITTTVIISAATIPTTTYTATSTTTATIVISRVRRDSSRLAPASPYISINSLFAAKPSPCLFPFAKPTQAVAFHLLFFSETSPLPPHQGHSHKAEMQHLQCLARTPLV
ncbi:hypothetical protein HID58_066070 [Brassica napus]|uniref:Uncharacterized protein n=1 Tax=Brassica napus TaxID=3708 RepID=A0ABQ7ZF40_BRANA|nr:hypothetical protein HID58_066070 [Brassica napus]